MFLGMKAPPLDNQDELLVLRALVDERQHGASSEKIDRKIEQFELMLEEIEASRAEAPRLKLVPEKACCLIWMIAPTSRNADLCPMAFQLKSGCTQPPAVADLWWHVHVPASVKIVRRIPMTSKLAQFPLTPNSRASTSTLPSLDRRRRYAPVPGPTGNR